MDFERAFAIFVNNAINGKASNVTNLSEAIEYAINKAYYDMQLRTIKGHRQEIKEKTTKALQKELEHLFNKPPKDDSDFDTWHGSACKAFLNAFNKAANTYSVTQQKYGKAQKIVNMSLKYLYCIFYCNKNNEFDNSQTKFNMDKDDVERIFKSCHMPLDSYTLNWYYKNKGKANELVWSSLDEDNYNYIKDEIRKCLQTHNVLPTNVLQAEFVIWQQEKTRAIVNELRKILANNDFDDEDLEPFKNAKKKETITKNANKIISIMKREETC